MCDINFTKCHRFGEEYGESIINSYVSLVNNICKRIALHYGTTNVDVYNIISPENEQECIDVIEKFYNGEELPFVNSFIRYEIRVEVEKFLKESRRYIGSGKYLHFPSRQLVNRDESNHAFSPYGFCVTRSQKCIYWKWLTSY